MSQPMLILVGDVGGSHKALVNMKPHLAGGLRGRYLQCLVSTLLT